MDKTVKIEFWQKIKTEIKITVSEEKFNLIKDLNNDNVSMYINQKGKIIPNKIYTALEDYLDFSYVTDSSDELEDVFVFEIN